MRTTIEHAGAERGLLILPRASELRIEAESKTSGDKILVHLKEAPVTAAALPESIVHYVVRTQETVILDDASWWVILRPKRSPADLNSSAR